MCALELKDIEELLLCNFEDSYNCVEEIPIYLKNLWNGNWEKLIGQKIFTDILEVYDNNDKLLDLLHCSKNEEIFCVGIASLFCFIQSNFTGPELPESLLDYLSKCNYNCKIYLTIDSEEIDVNTKYPELLLVSRLIFEYCNLENSNIQLWWKLRYIIIYQHLFDETSETLFNEIEEKLIFLLNWELKPRLKAKLYLEISQFYSLFGKINESESNLKIAKDLLKIHFELAGELGKRTKYQQSFIAQSVLNISIKGNLPEVPIKPTIVPEIIKLDDDVRLDSILLKNEETHPELPFLEQATILTTVQIMKRSLPNDDILLEESNAFISALLQQSNCWTVRYVILLLRCTLESKHKRTIERSLTQCESLINHLKQPEPHVSERLNLLFAANVQPIWKTEALMANLMLNVGLIKSSLDVYLRLQMWEEVIVCYTIMQLRHKATEVILKQLKQNETVKLWCLLGDATDDESYYEKAWNLSEEKSSRAQRHWGQYLFARKEYDKCISHLEKSLEINSLQNTVWLRLGFAALEIQDWKLAAKAYRRYTYLEPGGFEAWNNLAKAYIKLGEKNRAHYALQEALKYNFDNWKIWDNFMIVSADINNFFDVIRAYHKILDLKSKHLDLEILFLLTKKLVTNKNDSEQLNRTLLTKARELFGRLTSIYLNESKLWEMYSDLSPSAELKAQRLSRAYRSLAQDNWYKDADKCGKVLDICRRLAEVTMESNNNSIISSTRLILKAVVAVIKKQSLKQYTNELTQIEQLLDKLIDLITDK